LNEREGKRLLDAIRGWTDKAKISEQVLLNQRKQNNQEDARNFNILFSVLLGVITLVLIIVYIIINSNLRALRKAEAETADKNWVLAGSTELVKGMQGNKGIQELTQDIINHLSTDLNASVGA